MPWPIRFGAAAEDDHLGPLARRDLGLLVVGGVEVRRARRELGRAGVDASCTPAGCRARADAAHDVSVHAAELGDLRVGEAVPLGPAQQRRRSAGACRDLAATSLMRENWSTNQGSMPVASSTSLGVAPAAERLLHGAQPAVVRRRDSRAGPRASPGSPAQVGTPTPLLLQGPQGLLQRLGEVPADGHRLADALHVRGERAVGAGELLECEPRHLHHHVVERGLEAGRGCPVMSLGISSRVYPRASGPRSWRSGSRWPWRRARAARDPGVHLDHDHPAVAGSTANWMLQPPVSTPTSRMTRWRRPACAGIRGR